MPGTRTLSMRGFLLQIHTSREKDAFLKVLDKQLGLVSLYVPRLHSTRSPLHALSSLFGLLQLQVEETSRGYRVVEGELCAQFPNLTEDLTRQVQAQRLARLVIDLGIDAEEAELLHEILAYTFHTLNRMDCDPAAVSACAQLRMLSAVGFTLDETVLLRQPDDSGWHFHFGGPARQLSRLSSYSLSPGAGKALLYMLHQPPARLFTATMDPGVSRQLVEFARIYTAYCLDKDYENEGFGQQLGQAEEWADLLRQRRAESTMPAGSSEAVE